MWKEGWKCKMIKIGDVKITPTVFPDKTSQVWKLPKDLLDSLNRNTVITWEYEGDHELLPVCQLAYLIRTLDPVKCPPCLHIPYLPYGRQDKPIENNSTFGLHVFMIAIKDYFSKITSFDVHNATLPRLYHPNFINVEPSVEIERIIKDHNINYLVYPDKGACARYSHLSELESCSAEKVRDQLTGEITGMTINSIPLSRNILVIDDICDGGRTFVEVAKLIKNYNPEKLVLYISHGIFSKGTKVLFDAGFDFIYTKEGIVSNEN